MNQSFAATKSVLANVPTLVHPDPSTRISLSVDASGSHVGAVLQQEVSCFWAPIVFYSKKLSAPESWYSAFNHELFAAYSSLCYFPFMLEGRQFILFTDHNPLMFALFRTSPPWSTMQQRRLPFLLEFNCEICHLPGPENVVADALSCPEPSNVPQHPLSIPLISELQPTPPPPVPGISLSKMSLLHSPAQRLNFSSRLMCI